MSVDVELKEGRRTVLTTFPDLFTMVIVSMRGILVFVCIIVGAVDVEEDQLRRYESSRNSLF